MGFSDMGFNDLAFNDLALLGPWFSDVRARSAWRRITGSGKYDKHERAIDLMREFCFNMMVRKCSSMSAQVHGRELLNQCTRCHRFEIAAPQAIRTSRNGTGLACLATSGFCQKRRTPDANFGCGTIAR